MDIIFSLQIFTMWYLLLYSLVLKRKAGIILFIPCIIMSPVPVTDLLCPVFFVKVRNKSITNSLLMVSQSINTISHINKICSDIMIYACSIVCILVMRIDDMLDNAASTITILPIEKRLSVINFYMRQHRNYRSILLFTSNMSWNEIYKDHLCLYGMCSFSSTRLEYR